MSEEAFANLIVKVHAMGGQIVALQEARRDQEAITSGLLGTVGELRSLLTSAIAVNSDQERRLKAIEQQVAQFGFTNTDGHEVPPLPRPHPPADLEPMDSFEKGGK